MSVFVRLDVVGDHEAQHLSSGERMEDESPGEGRHRSNGACHKGDTSLDVSVQPRRGRPGHMLTGHALLKALERNRTNSVNGWMGGWADRWVDKWMDR